MKGIRLYILILLLLAVLATIVYFSQTTSTIKKELRDFAIEDTSLVDKIFMVNKSNEQVTLERKNNKWIVNGKFEARQDAIDIILKTLNRIDVKSPVSKSSFDNVVKKLATQSVKVEIYIESKLNKTIYVGGPTQDNYGTYMMLENSSTPFVVHIPGFPGYLSTRFFIEEQLWRSTSIFNYQFSEIEEITVDYPSKKENSFIASFINGNYTIQPLYPEFRPIRVDTSYVKEYFARFKSINFESFVVNISNEKKDSIINSVPYCYIKVKDFGNNIKSVKAFFRPADGTIDDDNNPHEFDPDRLYAFLQNDDMVIIQYYVFDQLFMDYNDFVKDNVNN